MWVLYQPFSGSAYAKSSEDGFQTVYPDRNYFANNVQLFCDDSVNSGLFSIEPMFLIRTSIIKKTLLSELLLLLLLSVYLFLCKLKCTVGSLFDSVMEKTTELSDCSVIHL